LFDSFPDFFELVAFSFLFFIFVVLRFFGSVFYFPDILSDLG